MSAWTLGVGTCVAAGVLAYFGVPLLLWFVAAAALLWLAGAGMLWWGLLAVPVVLLGVPQVRRALVATPLLRFFRAILPQVSQTEQEALDAGTVWWDGELFTGRPDWEKLRSYPAPALSAEEQAFIDGPVEELCRMLDDWHITHELHDLPPPVWRFIRDHGFLGMIIPKAYGGKGFSAVAHSEVVTRLTTRSGTAAVSVMVPNSLGPAELLLHYGTEEQKNHYLPRLARGQEMPCFALTSPEAGSDAGGIPDFGVVCRDTWEGRPDVLGIRLTWEKRYITLGPIATLLGLAFRLHDPDRLLGGEEDLGITLALIPTSTPGVQIGRRHLPLNAVFMNGPNWGKDVFIPMDCVIGGVQYVGQGWKMLMNCLAAGRSISLPGNSVGIAKLAALTTGAYGRVRTQFKTSIGRFEGVEEAIARIGGNLYVMEAARLMTAGAVDLGEKPAVVSAIVKYHLTERGRQVINDAMDVHGGKGICMGPSNYLARAYQATPIAITVEGANILTRSMIIFGQGAIRGHPWVLKEIEATRMTDPERAVLAFDEAFRGHVGFAVRSFVRALWLGLTGARLSAAPGDTHTRPYYRQLTRMSAAFAFSADIAMLMFGGALKRRERLSARLGDVLSQLYLASAALKMYEDGGRQSDEVAFVRWGLDDALHRAQEAFLGLFDNLPSRVLGRAMRRLVFPWGRPYEPPRDDVGREVVQALIGPSAVRTRLTRGVHVRDDENDPIGGLEAALAAVIAAEPVEAKLRAGQKAGTVTGRFPEEIVAHALAAGVLTPEEAAVLARAQALRRKVIMVDDFPKDLGKTEIHQTTQAVTFEALLGRRAAGGGR